MKLNAMDKTPSGALFTNALAVFSFLASVLASPILTTTQTNSIAAAKPHCKLSSCELGRQCFKANSCFGVNLLDEDWSHCKIFACPSQAFGGRTDPQCVIDTECLNVQLGNKPDPCAQKKQRSEAVPEIAGRESNPQRGDDGTIDPFSTKPDIKTPADIIESNAIKEYLNGLPEGSFIDPEYLKSLRESQPPFNTKTDRFDIDHANLEELIDLLPPPNNKHGRSDIDPANLEKLKNLLPPSHIIYGRSDTKSDLMSEFARLVDDSPSGPITPDADMMERLKSITHPGKRGGCYTFENGEAVEKRGGGGGGSVDGGGDGKIDGDVDLDVDVDLRKRGGCYIIENGVKVEKRGGCGNIEDKMHIINDIDYVGVHKRGGCYTIENGVEVEKRGGCGNIEENIKIDSDVDVTIHKRGGCYTVENGVMVEKRGGCGGIEDDMNIINDIDYVGVHKRGGCYTIEIGAIVEKRGGCGTAEKNIDIDGEINGDIGVDLNKRGGCFTVENGVIVEKRGGCGSVDIEAQAEIEKRVGCFVNVDGMVYAKPDCNSSVDNLGPPFPGEDA